MKQIPILFSSMMVQAILAGRKTMTRRMMKPQPEYDPEVLQVKHGPGPFFWPIGRLGQQCGLMIHEDKCPYGKPGVILYVKESYYQYGKWQYGDKLTKKKRQLKNVFAPLDDDISFNLTKTFGDQTFTLDVKPKSYRLPAWYKRLGRFMPKKYARIWLEVTDMRVERLQDISPHDACEEGVEYWNVDPDAFEGGELQADFMNYTWVDDEKYEDYHFPHFANAVDSFRTLWQKINGPGTWESNPWVWVVSFKILSTTGKPAGLEKEVAV